MHRLSIVAVGVTLHLNRNLSKFLLHKSGLSFETTPEATQETKPNLTVVVAGVLITLLRLAGRLVIPAQGTCGIGPSTETHPMEGVSTEHRHQKIIRSRLLMLR